MKAYLTNHEFRSEPTKCSLWINHIHDLTNQSELIGVHIRVVQLPLHFCLGGSIDIELSFDEARSIMNRLARAIGEHSQENSEITQGEK